MANIKKMNRRWKNGLASSRSLRSRPALTRAELAQAYWRAVSRRALRQAQERELHSQGPDSMPASRLLMSDGGLREDEHGQLGVFLASKATC